jgi:hypothetical protein
MQNDGGDLNDVRRQRAVANRVFRNEFQQGGIDEIVFAGEENALMRELGMMGEVVPQARGVAGIEEFHGATKGGIGNPFLMRQLQAIGKAGIFDMGFQPRPACEAALPRHGQLSVAELYLGAENFGIGGASEARMKFPELLGHVRTPRGVTAKEIFRLMPEMNQAGMRREAFYRHDKPLSYAQVRMHGQKESLQRRIAVTRWTSVLSADRMRPVRAPPY